MYITRFHVFGLPLIGAAEVKHRGIRTVSFHRVYELRRRYVHMKKFIKLIIFQFMLYSFTIAPKERID